MQKCVHVRYFFLDCVFQFASYLCAQIFSYLLISGGLACVWRRGRCVKRITWNHQIIVLPTASAPCTNLRLQSHTHHPPITHPPRSYTHLPPRSHTHIRVAFRIHGAATCRSLARGTPGVDFAVVAGAIFVHWVADDRTWAAWGWGGWGACGWGGWAAWEAMWRERKHSGNEHPSLRLNPKQKPNANIQDNTFYI